MQKDNRVHPRLLVRLPGEFRVGANGPWHQGTIHDISANGATLLVHDRIPPQTLLRLRLRLPGSGADLPLALEVESVVLRSERLSAGGGNSLFREALHFLDLVGEPFERVRRYVFERREGLTA